jgi:hypothetical protein
VYCRREKGNSRPGGLAAGVLSLVLLVGALSAARHLNWIPWLKPPKKPAVNAALSPAAPVAIPAPQKTAVAATDSRNPSQASGDAALQPAVTRRETVAPAPPAGKPSGVSALEPLHSNDPDAHVSEVATKSVVTPTSAKPVVPRSSDKTVSVSPQPPPSALSEPASPGGSVVPPNSSSRFARWPLRLRCGISIKAPRSR